MIPKYYIYEDHAGNMAVGIPKEQDSFESGLIQVMTPINEEVKKSLENSFCLLEKELKDKV